jgi:hypothetical protein
VITKDGNVGLYGNGTRADLCLISTMCADNTEVWVNDYVSMGLIGIFPGVVTFGISLPFDQVLQGFVASPSLVCMDLFHFIFFFSINQIRGRSCKVGPMCWCFSVRCQETGVKHRVNTPLGWEFKLYSDWRDDLCDLEGSMASRS